MFTKYTVQRCCRIVFLGLLTLALSGVIGGLAQDAAPTAPTPLRVEVQAADGLTLVGDLYNAELNVQTPALLLMHMYGGRRGDWQPLIPALTGAGYRVIAVDLRGHGETGGSNDWQAAIGDVQTWLDWIESQPANDPDKIAIIGASIGANLALVGCANDTHCVTAVALSPGLDYYRVTTSDALAALNQRSALLFAARSDRPSGDDVPQLLTAGRGEVAVHLLSGRAHGTALLPARGVETTILNWLDVHLR